MMPKCAKRGSVTGIFVLNHKRYMYSVAQLKEIFLAYLNDNAFNKEPKELFEPANYIMQLGGKRLRPIMVLMSYNLFKQHIQPALPLALAIEIFHNFSLVHDDIMDEAPLRRGQPTIHNKYDINTGILSGDIMLIYAYSYLLKIEEKQHIPRLIETLSEVAEAVCIGQQYDINFETKNLVTIPEYFKMIEYKTAMLLVGALKMGAILANASELDEYHIGEFGRNIGLAFQLQDDILDTFGDAQKFGKRVGGDIIQNKKTYLVLKTLEVADEEDKKQLNELMKNQLIDEEIKIQTISALFRKNNILRLANCDKQAYQNKAYQHLKKVEIEEIRKKELSDLAASLLERKI